jgi:hypothetical protein
LTSLCPSQLTNIVYEDGTVAIWVVFIDAKGPSGLVVFSGSKVTSSSSSKYTLDIDKLLLNGRIFGAKRIDLEIQGTCNFYGDISNEEPTFKCRARAKNKVISDYEFVTDGDPPTVN